MNNIDQKQWAQMLSNLKTGLDMQKRHREYEKNTTIEQYCHDLQNVGIDFREEEVVNKYRELENYSEVLDYFYYKDEGKWHIIDGKKNTQFNSDSQMYFISKIIEKHFDVNTLLDPHFIEDTMQYLDTTCPKDAIQENVMNVIERLIGYANKKGINKLDGIIEYYNVNRFMQFFIKKCHNRDRKFKELIKKYYDTFEDVDKSIYKIK